MNIFEALSAALPRPAILRDRDEKYRRLTAAFEKASADMEAFLSSLDGYAFYFSYRTLLEEGQTIELEGEKILRTHRFFKSESYQKLKNAYQSFLDNRRYFSQKIASHNEEYLKVKVDQAYALIGNVEGRKLDFQQMSCIVKDADSHLVIAGAGTGKTTTILGKVKYLLSTRQVKPEELLILSFTNASAEEMKKRLQQETNSNIYVATFHKLGYDIIRRANKITPKIYSNSISQFIRESIEKHLKDAEYRRLFTTYLLFHQIQQKNEFDFESGEEYREYLETNPPTTINDEQVKSYGEMNIANYLASHNVRYQYEREYPIDTRTEDRAQYTPDFFLPDYNIYIEYFGIDKHGNAPSWFVGKNGKTGPQAYKEDMEWKRELHKNNGTTLLECYAYENMDGTLLNNLQKKLESHNVALREVPLDSLLEQGSSKQKNVLSSVTEIMSTTISLAKNRKMQAAELVELCRTKCPSEVPLAALTTPVMEDYENHLRENNAVDFTDLLIQAEELTVSNVFVHKFKYVIIDEYQDLSSAQYRLLKAMRNQSFYSLFCVGDDWQSIYRFAGSDIGYILNYDSYWENSERSYISTTYRFSQSLIDISGNFIMKNPNQLKKYIRSGNDTDHLALGSIHGYTENAAMRFISYKLQELPEKSTVFFIGRYQFDVDLLRDNTDLSMNYDNVNRRVNITFERRKDLKMSYFTAHRSKGLQADYVFIINNRSARMGFPSKVQNPPLIELFLEQADQFPDAEERRLYYVALTRARRKVFLVTAGKKISPFAEELINAYATEIKDEKWTCPLCGGKLQKRSGKYGDFYGCSNYKSKNCRFTRAITSK